MADKFYKKKKNERKNETKKTLVLLLTCKLEFWKIEKDVFGSVILNANQLLTGCVESKEDHRERKSVFLDSKERILSYFGRLQNYL